MKRNLLAAVGMVGVALAAGPVARAGDVHWGVGINLGPLAIGLAGGGAVMRVQAPPPPRVVVVTPAPVVCAPRTVAIGPAPLLPPPPMFVAGPAWGWGARTVVLPAQRVVCVPQRPQAPVCVPVVIRPGHRGHGHAWGHERH